MDPKLPIQVVSEAIEAAAYADLLAGLPSSERERLGLQVIHAEGALGLLASGVDSLLFNRVIGVGVLGPSSREVVGSLCAAYRRAGIRRFFFHVSETARASELGGWLAEQGLAPYRRSWVKFIRGRTPPPKTNARLPVRKATDADATSFARLMTLGLAIPAAGMPLFAAALSRAGWHGWVATDGERPVAAALLYCRGELGYLAGAATLPEYRRQGCQAALMQRRIELALELGCRWLIAETGEAVPEQANHSYDNLLRMGFAVIGVRHNYCQPGESW